MNSLQRDRIQEFETEVKNRGGHAATGWKESDAPESHGILFAEVDGITLMLYLDGLISIPAVRTYHPPRYSTPVIAAALATELWAKQKARDDAKPELAKSRRTGHLGSIVGTDLKCRSKVCPCQNESQAERQRRARGGYNWNPDRSW
jgi:hypothetical protein